MSAIGIDIGSSNVRLALVGDYGSVIETEPAIVSVDQMKNVTACGLDSELLMKRSPGSAAVVYPFATAQLPDQDQTQAFFNYLIKSHRLKGSDVFFSYAGERNDELERLYVGAMQKAGIREAYAVDAGYAAAVGCGIKNVGESVIVNVGDKVTDVIAFVHNKPASVFHNGYAGDSFSRAIASYVFKKHRSKIERREADRIKEEIGVLGHSQNKTIEFKAMKTSLGLPERYTLTSSEISGAIEQVFDEFADAIISVTRSLPAEPDKIVLTGGGAKLNGLASQLSPLVSLPVEVADKPEEAIIRGLYNLADKKNNKRK